MPHHLHCLALIAFSLALTGCDCNCHAPTAAKTASTEATTGHPLRGTITQVLTAEQSLKVKHATIPGVMPAMTMDFRVDAATLAQAKVGQAIAATLVSKGDDYWLEDVKAASPAPAAR